MRKFSLIVAALLLLVGLSACGSSSGSDAGDTTTTTGKTATTTAKTTTTGKDSSPKTTTTGGDEGPTTTAAGTKGEGDDAYVTSLAKALAANSSTAAIITFDQEQATCVAPKWVEIIGTDTFDAKGVKPADLEKPGFGFPSLGLDEKQATAMIAAVEDCDIDPVGAARKLISANLDAAQQACLSTELDDVTLRAILVQSLYKTEPDGSLKTELDRIQSTCKLGGGSSSSSGATPKTVPAPVRPGG